jgi:hypothetical protein
MREGDVSSYGDPDYDHLVWTVVIRTNHESPKNYFIFASKQRATVSFRTEVWTQPELGSGGDLARESDREASGLRCFGPDSALA